MMEKNSNENTCSSCGRCGSCGGGGSCGNSGSCMMSGGCHGGMHGHFLAKKILMILILAAVFCLGTQVGELKSAQRHSRYNSGYGMMGNYRGDYNGGSGMMGWWGTDEDQAVIIPPQTKADQEVIVNSTKAVTPTKK
ncbi:MAG: hypothetical protein WCK91_00025 [bacterium]